MQLAAFRRSMTELISKDNVIEATDTAQSVDICRIRSRAYTRSESSPVSLLLLSQAQAEEPETGPWVPTLRVTRTGVHLHGLRLRSLLGSSVVTQLDPAEVLDLLLYEGPDCSPGAYRDWSRSRRSCSHLVRNKMCQRLPSADLWRLSGD